MPRSRIYVYTICWNEEAMLPFFLDWYGSWADRIVVYDNGSDDRSAEIVRAHPKGDLRPFHTEGGYDERNLLHVKNQAWKEHRAEADWVVVVDVDEFVTFGTLGPQAAVAQAAARGAAVIRPLGFNVILGDGERLERRPDRFLFEDHHQGVHHKQSSKPCMFDPKKVESVEFLPGAHRATFTPPTPIHRDLRIRLFHYKFVGVEVVVARYRRYAERLSQFNKDQGYCFHYLEPEQKIRDEYAELVRRRHDVRARLATAPVVGPVLRAAFAAATRLGMNA